MATSVKFDQIGSGPKYDTRTWCLFFSASKWSQSLTGKTDCLKKEMEPSLSSCLYMTMNLPWQASSEIYQVFDSSIAIKLYHFIFVDKQYSRKTSDTKVWCQWSVLGTINFTHVDAQVLLLNIGGRFHENWLHLFAVMAPWGVEHDKPRANVTFLNIFQKFIPQFSHSAWGWKGNSGCQDSGQRSNTDHLCWSDRVQVDEASYHRDEFLDLTWEYN